tara:strand:+ start:412 stop:687 length:276 start_codon:yes stop_codon:yes gene_type:complete
MNYYLITSQSYSENQSGIISFWDNDESNLMISASADYSYPYSQSFDTYDDMQSWIWNYDTNEWKNWDEDTEEDDPYGIDGPFPEEMDETII